MAALGPLLRGAQAKHGSRNPSTSELLPTGSVTSCDKGLQVQVQHVATEAMHGRSHGSMALTAPSCTKVYQDWQFAVLYHVVEAGESLLLSLSYYSGKTSRLAFWFCMPVSVNRATEGQRQRSSGTPRAFAWRCNNSLTRD